jgi:H+-transporting ATPase
VSISDFLTLFSARTGDNFFWTTAPAPILMGAGFIALTISTILACTWPSGDSDGVYAMGLGRRKPYTLALYIWLYCIVWWFIQDACKVFAFYILKKYNILGYNDTGESMELLFLLVEVAMMMTMMWVLVMMMIMVLVLMLMIM